MRVAFLGTTAFAVTVLDDLSTGYEDAVVAGATLVRGRVHDAAAEVLGRAGTPISDSAAQISSTVCAAHHASIRARRASGPALPTSGVSSPCLAAPPSTRRMSRAAISRPPALITT